MGCAMAFLGVWDGGVEGGWRLGPAKVSSGWDLYWHQGRLRTVHTAEDSLSNASMSCYDKIYDIIFPYLYYISSRK